MYLLLSILVSINAKSVFVEDVFLDGGNYTPDFGNVTAIRRIVPPPPEHISLVIMVLLLYFILIIAVCFWSRKEQRLVPKIFTGYTNVTVTETVDL